MEIAIIGGGAAGFFTAINIKELQPNTNVTIYEASSSVLAKVAVSGGGRCNLTNSFEEIKNLASAYPRGEKLLKRVFRKFNHKDTYEWFEENGVELVTQSDNCVFPYSQNSEEIIELFIRLANKHKIDIRTSHKVTSIERINDSYKLTFNDDAEYTNTCGTVVVTTGGSTRREGLSMLDSVPMEIVNPVPSLFSLNMPNDPITELTGTVVENVIVGIQGTKFKASGALLITHWGMSGPAILKLSSYAAQYLNKNSYSAKLSVNWINETIEPKIHAQLNNIIESNSQKLVTSIRPFNLPARLWLSILNRAEISEERRWAEVGRKGLNKLVNLLTNDEYNIQGKNRYKEEFVTCGGISLDSINHATMESLEYPNLYLAGEVLDIDAITGGFNLQAAWSTGYVVADSIKEKINN